MILGVTVGVRSSEAQEPICLTGNVKASLVFYNSRFKKPSLYLVSRLPGWVQPSPSKALERGILGVTSSEPLPSFACLHRQPVRHRHIDYPR